MTDGFRLKAKNVMADIEIRKFMVRDPRISIVEISKDDELVELRFIYHNTRGLKHMIAAAPWFVAWFVEHALRGKGLKLIEDYEFEVLT